jgi:hypothetical protein
MAELDGGDGALLGDERRDRRERVALRVVPKAEAMRRDAPARLDMRDLGADDAGAADRARAEMLQMPDIRHALDGRILAHRREHDSVARSHRAQRQRPEEMRIGIAPQDAAIVLPRFRRFRLHRRRSERIA